MSTRREQLLDAAIEVVGTRGLRALTHRAVEAQAGLPAGSTSNLFRRRADLVAGVLERLLERETAAWDGIDDDAPRAGAGPGAADVDRLSVRVRVLTGPMRALTITRFALYHEAAHDPQLQQLVAHARARVEHGMTDWLARLGVRMEPSAVAGLLSTMNGLLVERVSTAGQADADPAPAVRLVLGGAIDASSTAVGAAPSSRAPVPRSPAR